MTDKEEEFLRRLLSTFKVEAAEHLKAMQVALFALESAPSAIDRVRFGEQIYREAHSLKGAARAVDRNAIENVCQALETVLAPVAKSGDLSRDLAEVVHQVLDSLQDLVASSDSGRPGRLPSKVRGLISQLTRGEFREREARGMSDTSVPSRAPAVLEDTLRISAEKLHAVLRGAEELIAAKLTTRHRVREVQKIQSFLNTAMNNWNESTARDLRAAINELSRSTQEDSRSLDTITDTLLEDMKQALMLPVAPYLQLFPAIVRAIAREQNRQVAVRIEAAEIQVDRRILEGMKNPLVHLLRNSIDHGVEPADVREKRGKPREATLTLAISELEGGRIEVLVSDDGGGIDQQKVQAAADRLGIGPAPATDLVFHSGITTSPNVTALSGRGLGLAIVREKVEVLGGTITVESTPGEGTAFRIRLPMTLSTYRGVVVRTGDHLLVMPTAGIERMIRISQDDIRTVENRETIELAGKAISVVRLADVLELAAASSLPPPARLPAFIAAYDGKRLAFVVDEVVGEQEVLVKGLGKQLSRVRNISGAAVLATGGLAPILHTPDLIKSAIKASERPRAVASGPAPAEEPKKSILVVEDSITARTLMKNILEVAGYRVRAAVDGLDALAQLRMDTFDLIVSDVDMPRMNGFDLTATVRAEEKLADLPVILVTGLESAEDKERGINAGANAYVVKKSFDQENLLELVRRLA